MKHGEKIIGAAILFLGIVLLLAGCGNSSTLPSSRVTTNLSGVNSASSKSINGLSLSLSLDSTTYQPGHEITITLDEVNTLPNMNNIPKSDNWAYDHLQRDPCDFISPFGAAIFRGDYTSLNFSAATPLTIYDPHAIRLCPTNAPIISYPFQPSSDTANVIEDSNLNPGNNSRQFKYEVTIKGYWPDNDYHYTSQLIGFVPGIYTVVAGDEWGNLVLLHYTVIN